MHHFEYHNGQLHCEQVPLAQIAAEVGTPVFVYAHTTIERHYRVFTAALANIPHLICFSAKANTNGAVLATLGRLGAGADIVSGGELNRALRAGIAASRIVFSGVGKRADEIADALSSGILMFNVESEAELLEIDRVARHLGRKAPVALRVNPNVDAGTHPYIATGLRDSKFGIPFHHAWEVYDRALKLSNVDVRGIDCHIGSQLTKIDPLVDSLSAVVQMAKDLRTKGVPLNYLDIGGGLGIRYDEETPPSPADYGCAVNDVLQKLALPDLTIICEPGRVIMGNAGVLVTRVLYLKSNDDKQFVIVDAAMNDLLRPSLYASYHAIQPVQRHEDDDGETTTVDVVGPICESGDFFAKGRALPPVKAGDLLAVMSAGAYGFTMSSNYNSRPRAAEVMVRQDEHAVVRSRETYEDLTRGEQMPTWLAKS